MHEHGGYGIAVQCDHSQLDQVEALFARVQREAGKLDLLVDNAWGDHENFDGKFHSPFWEQPLSHWDAMFDRGVRNHWLSSRCAAPLLVAQKRGLTVTTTFWDRDRYRQGNLLYDLAKAAMTRLAFGMAEELRGPKRAGPAQRELCGYEAWGFSRKRPQQLSLTGGLAVMPCRQRRDT